MYSLLYFIQFVVPDDDLLLGRSVVLTVIAIVIRRNTTMFSSIRLYI